MNIERCLIAWRQLTIVINKGSYVHSWNKTKPKRDLKRQEFWWNQRRQSLNLAS